MHKTFSGGPTWWLAKFLWKYGYCWSSVTRLGLWGEFHPSEWKKCDRYHGQLFTWCGKPRGYKYQMIGG